MKNASPSLAAKALDLAHRWQLDHVVEALETKLVKDSAIAFTRDRWYVTLRGFHRPIHLMHFNAYELLRENLLEQDLSYFRCRPCSLLLFEFRRYIFWAGTVHSHYVSKAKNYIFA